MDGLRTRTRQHVERVISRITAAAGLAVLAFATFAGGANALAPRMTLTAGTDFTITSSITAWPSCSGGTAILAPGLTRCFKYVVTNHLSVPISVTTLSLSPDTTTLPTPPPECVSAIQAGATGTNFTGSFVVGASPANLSSPGLPITMIDTPSNQDACKNLLFHFSYSGTAQFTPAATTPTPSTGAVGEGLGMPERGSLFGVGLLMLGFATLLWRRRRAEDHPRGNETTP